MMPWRDEAHATLSRSDQMQLGRVEWEHGSRKHARWESTAEEMFPVAANTDNIQRRLFSAMPFRDGITVIVCPSMEQPYNSSELDE
jgi:hypothetical protein